MNDNYPILFINNYYITQSFHFCMQNLGKTIDLVTID